MSSTKFSSSNSGTAIKRLKTATADRSALGQARLELFQLYKGPWSDLDNHRAFLPGVPERKPLGASFYPEDMTREEFEGWASDKAKSFFTVIRRKPGSRALEVIPTAAPIGPIWIAPRNCCAKQRRSRTMRR